MLDNLNFNYFTVNAFNDSMANENNINFSLFHMNIRSLNKNNEKFYQFLSTVEHNFDVLVLSEIWSYNVTLYRNLIPGYVFYYDLPNESNVGGIGVYVKDTLTHCIVDNYKISSVDDCRIENLWIEVIKEQNRYIVGWIYRHPGYKINTFTEKLNKGLTQIFNYKLPCFIAGDINIDLKRFQTHQDTKTYLDNLILNNFMPVVVMPSRISEKSATLIDHIYYSGGSKSINDVVKGGNLWCDITDHLPNFVCLENRKKEKLPNSNLPHIRIYSQKIFKKSLLLL